MSEQVRVVVVDDHPMVRAGLAAQLQRGGDVTVVAEAGTVADACDVVLTHAPDVVLVDHQLPDGTGRDVLRRVGSACAVVLVTGYDDQTLVHEYLQDGAAGYAHKTAGPEQLTACVRHAAAGTTALDPASVHRTLLAPRTPTGTGTLSPRELEVLGYVAQGLTNEAIGSRLRISPETVKTHLSRIYPKLGVADRAHAAVVATRRGLL